MPIAALSSDFWDTLYRHVGTVEYRRHIRDGRLGSYLEQRGYGNYARLGGSFFGVLDRHIKDEWKLGYAPNLDRIVGHVSQELQLGSDVASKLVTELLEEVDEIYASDLKPEPIPGAADFLQWASSKWPTYLICDTYTLGGVLLDRVLEADGLLPYLAGRYYSDQLGV